MDVPCMGVVRTYVQMNVCTHVKNVRSYVLYVRSYVYGPLGTLKHLRRKLGGTPAPPRPPPLLPPSAIRTALSNVRRDGVI